MRSDVFALASLAPIVDCTSKLREELVNRSIKHGIRVYLHSMVSSQKKNSCKHAFQPQHALVPLPKTRVSTIVTSSWQNCQLFPTFQGSKKPVTIVIIFTCTDSYC